MANVNQGLAGWANLPVQSVTTANQTTLLVPPSSALYQGLPSPVFAAGAGLFVNLSNTTQSSNPQAASPTYTNDLIDGKQFRIRVVGLATVAASTHIQLGLYQGSSSTTTSDTLIAISASYAITTASSVNFVFETNLIWDSTTTNLNGWFQSDVNNVFTGSAAITQITNLAVTNLQFIPSVIYATSNSGNTWTVKEFLVETV